MSKPALSITEDDILTALRTFLLSVLPTGIEVIQGQDNRVPEPKGPDFVVMTPMSRARLATNTDSWTGAQPTTMMIVQPTQVTVQLDLHGAGASDSAQLVSTLARDYYGIDHVDSATIVPLYTNDAIQVPFINGEGQYEDRWTMNIVMQVSPIVVTEQQFADIVSVTITSAEVV